LNPHQMVWSQLHCQVMLRPLFSTEKNNILKAFKK
jgi:hypothetical protein